MGRGSEYHSDARARVPTTDTGNKDSYPGSDTGSQLHAHKQRLALSCVPEEYGDLLASKKKKKKKKATEKAGSL